MIHRPRHVFQRNRLVRRVGRVPRVPAGMRGSRLPAASRRQLVGSPSTADSPFRAACRYIGSTASRKRSSPAPEGEGAQTLRPGRGRRRGLHLAEPVRRQVANGPEARRVRRQWFARRRLLRGLCRRAFQPGRPPADAFPGAATADRRGSYPAAGRSGTDRGRTPRPAGNRPPRCACTDWTSRGRSTRSSGHRAFPERATARPPGRFPRFLRHLARQQLGREHSLARQRLDHLIPFLGRDRGDRDGHLVRLRPRSLHLGIDPALPRRSSTWPLRA